MFNLSGNLINSRGVHLAILIYYKGSEHWKSITTLRKLNNPCEGEEEPLNREISLKLYFGTQFWKIQIIKGDEAKVWYQNFPCVNNLGTAHQYLLFPAQKSQSILSLQSIIRMVWSVAHNSGISKQNIIYLKLKQTGLWNNTVCTHTKFHEIICTS